MIDSNRYYPNQEVFDGNVLDNQIDLLKQRAVSSYKDQDLRLLMQKMNRDDLKLLLKDLEPVFKYNKLFSIGICLPRVCDPTEFVEAVNEGKFTMIH